MSPTASSAELRDWITRHLDPLEITGGRVRRSDFDLNPEHAPAEPAVLTPAAVLVALVEREAGLNVILTKRSENLRRHTGQIAFPGGRLDPGETPWAAALREAHEEIGLHPDYVSLAGLTEPWETGTGYLITPVVGFVRDGFSLTPNAEEVDEIFETPFGFLMDPANYEEHEREWSGTQRKFYAATHENRYIWGATAGMLRALYDRLYGAALA